MTTDNLLLLIFLGVVFMVYIDSTNEKKTIKNENNRLKKALSNNETLLKEVEHEKEIEKERRKKELARIAMLEQRKKELAWRIELLTRLKYIKRIKRIKRRFVRRPRKIVIRK